jgi:nucleoside-diphosphate-sugar epimerase
LTITVVTGGAGFIGSHLVRALCGRGDQVRVIDNLSTGRGENLAGVKADLVVADIRDQAALARAMRDAEQVFHLAAMISVPESMADPVGCYDANVIGTVDVLQAARDAGARRMVLSSSCAVYGDTTGPVGEDAPPQPLSPYAASKLAMEDAGRLFAAAFGMGVVSLRYFNVYGPRQSPDSPYAAAIPIFIRQLLAGVAPTIYGDGGQTRDFVYVEDVVRANLLASSAEAVSGDILNIGGGRSISILELIGQLRSLIPGAPEAVFGPARAGDIRLSAAKIGRAARAIGFHPATDLARGLQASIAWHRQTAAETPI